MSININVSDSLRINRSNLSPANVMQICLKIQSPKITRQWRFQPVSCADQFYQKGEEPAVHFLGSLSTRLKLSVKTQNCKNLGRIYCKINRVTPLSERYCKGICDQYECRSVFRHRRATHGVYGTSAITTFTTILLRSYLEIEKGLYFFNC